MAGMRQLYAFNDADEPLVDLAGGDGVDGNGMGGGGVIVRHVEEGVGGGGVSQIVERAIGGGNEEVGCGD